MSSRINADIVNPLAGLSAQSASAGMFRPVFVTGTGTDVGKTYVTALLCRKLRQSIEQACSSDIRAVGYYKAAISGADSIESSDAGMVNSFAGLGQEPGALTSYLYAEAVSPHLAQQHEGSAPIDIKTVGAGYKAVHDQVMLTVLEGSGGIYCPLSWSYERRPYLNSRDESELAADTHAVPDTKTFSRSNPESSPVLCDLNDRCFTIGDFMAWINSTVPLNIVVVADASLGCINNTVMTLTSLKAEGFDLANVSVILNNYEPTSAMHVDNCRMIEAMTAVPVVATVERGAQDIELHPHWLSRILTRVQAVQRTQPGSSV